MTSMDSRRVTFNSCSRKDMYAERDVRLLLGAISFFAAIYAFSLFYREYFLEDYPGRFTELMISGLGGLGFLVDAVVKFKGLAKIRAKCEREQEEREAEFALREMFRSDHDHLYEVASRHPETRAMLAEVDHTPYKLTYAEAAPLAEKINKWLDENDVLAERAAVSADVRRAAEQELT